MVCALNATAVCCSIGCRLRDDTRSDPNVLAYLSAENSYADTALQPLAALAGKLANEMESRLSNVTEPVPVKHGSWWYHEQQLPGQTYWLHYRSQATLVKHASTIRDGSVVSGNSSKIQQKSVPSDKFRTFLNMSNSSSQPAGHGISSSSSNKHGKLGRNLLTRIHARTSKLNHGGKSALRPTSAGAAAAAAAAADSYSYDSWDSSVPDTDAPVQLVLDPNRECAAAASGVDDTGSESSPSSQHCDVFGATVSPDGALVAFGVDVSGSELYQLMVRNISSNKPLVMPVISGTSGDYEWGASSQGLFFITRNATTNRPDQAWYVDLSTAQPVLLWKEDNAAFYLSLSRSSSGRFLLLASASEVTRQVVLMDLETQQQAGRVPSADDWLHLAPRQAGVQQQAVAHWHSWLFLLVVSPSTPNGELRAAPVSRPQQHRVRPRDRQLQRDRHRALPTVAPNLCHLPL
jgi:protease II